MIKLVGLQKNTQQGASIIEYILLLALIAIVAIGVVKIVGEKIGDPDSGSFARIEDGIKTGGSGIK